MQKPKAISRSESTRPSAMLPPTVHVPKPKSNRLSRTARSVRLSVDERQWITETSATTGADMTVIARLAVKFYRDNPEQAQAFIYEHARGDSTNPLAVQYSPEDDAWIVHAAGSDSEEAMSDVIRRVLAFYRQSLDLDSKRHTATGK